MLLLLLLLHQVLFAALDPSSPLQPYINTLPGVCPGVHTPQV